MPDSPENPHAGQGSVLLDIGGEIGALVVTMPDGTAGQEVEIQRIGDEGHGHAHDQGHAHGHRPHVAVVRRPVQGGEVPSLVFPELREGRYELFDKGDDRVRLVADIQGGQVTAADWP